MRKIILVFIILFSPAISFAQADKIFKENSKAVVVVVTYNEKGEAISQGSGFIVSEDGAVVTNYHVISNARDIKVKAGDKILDVEGLILADKENDLVILKIKGEKFPVVKLGDIARINIGEKVYVISSPQGLENTVSDGILSGIREITSDKKILQITAPISSGSSGSPVFNSNGEVIGIATFIIKEAQNLNFAMPVNYIKGKIGSEKVTALKESKIEDYKKTAEYWFYLGLAYYKLGKYKDAIESFKQSITIKPDSAEANLNLSASYDKLGNYSDAIEPLKRAIKIKPDYAEAHYILGLAYGKLGMNKEAIDAFKQAIEPFKQAIRIEPDDAETHFCLGSIYALLNNEDSALEEYKILKNLDPQMANKLFDLITPAAPVKGAEWENIGEDDKTKISLDLSSIKKLPNHYYRVWRETVFKNASDTIKSSKEYNEYDCDNKRSKTLQQTLYKKDGDVKTFNEKKSWKYIIPDTQEELPFMLVCNNDRGKWDKLSEDDETDLYLDWSSQEKLFDGNYRIWAKMVNKDPSDTSESQIGYMELDCENKKALLIILIIFQRDGSTEYLGETTLVSLPANTWRDVPNSNLYYKVCSKQSKGIEETK